MSAACSASMRWPSAALAWFSRSRSSGTRLLYLFPRPAVAAVLTANAVFVVFGRLSWSVAAVTGWLIALAACPLVLPRRAAVLAVAPTEGAVLLGMADLRRNLTPSDAPAAEALAVSAPWGAGQRLRRRRT